MTAVNAAIVEQYETLGLSSGEIAEQEGLDETVIKAVLLQCSDKFRKENGEVSQLDFSDEDLIAANDIIRNLAKYSEDENLRARMATYIRDDKKGRKNPIAQLANKGQPINALIFNVQFEKARRAIERATGRVIELATKEGDVSVAQ